VLVPSRFQLNDSQVFDLLRAIMAIVGCVALNQVKISSAYHFIRGQSTIKLYVIFNVLEIMDRLLISFGQDILDALWYKYSSKGEVDGSARKTLSPLLYLFIAIVYVCLHAFVLFAQVVALNVAINSYNNAMVALLVSNQFIELKKSVFRTFKEDTLFRMTCSGKREVWLLFFILWC